MLPWGRLATLAASERRHCVSLLACALVADSLGCTGIVWQCVPKPSAAVLVPLLRDQACASSPATCLMSGGRRSMKQR